MNGPLASQRRYRLTLITFFHAPPGASRATLGRARESAFGAPSRTYLEGRCMRRRTTGTRVTLEASGWANVLDTTSGPGLKVRGLLRILFGQVLDGRGPPDLAGFQVDAPTVLAEAGFEQLRQVLQVDRQGSPRRGRTPPKAASSSAANSSSPAQPRSRSASPQAPASSLALATPSAAAAARASPTSWRTSERTPPRIRTG